MLKTKYLLGIILNMEKEAFLYKRIGSGKVVCSACARRCVIPEGSHGFCFVRQNRSGRLILANYALLSSMQLDPIEKKPFNHFMPGTAAFSIGTVSCSWGCRFCQNHNISKEREISGVELSPEAAVKMALESGAGSIAYTYNEPSIFIEYALDVARLAHKAGLRNLFVTNGYLTEEGISAMKGLVDAAVVNFKGNGDEKFAHAFEAVTSNEPVKSSILAMKSAGIHVELTDLIIPRVGDSIEACEVLVRWVHDEAGADTPIHFTRFHPDYKMLDYPSTSFETLKRHLDAAKRAGLSFVYIGNVPGNPYESTYCPKCGAIAIGRDGFGISEWRLDMHMRCKACGYVLPVKGAAPDMRRRNIISIY